MKKWIIAGIAVLVLVGGLGLGGYVLLGSSGGGDMTSAAGDMALEDSAPVPVQRGDISSKLVLDAVVSTDPETKVKARQGGTVTRVWVRNGLTVRKGDPIVSVRTASGAGESDGGSGDRDGGEAPAAGPEVTVSATAAGKVSGLGGLANGDVLEPGATVVVLRKSKFRATAEIKPNELYRFTGDPERIMLKVDKGPAAEECSFLDLKTPDETTPDAGDGSGGDGGGGEGGGDSGGAKAEITCRIPADFTVFSGVTAKMSVVTGTSKNAVVVPVTAVRGTADEGEVLVVGANGKNEVRAVELGVSDGEQVEVTDGLTTDDRVLDPVPLSKDFDVPSDDAEDEGGMIMGPGF